MSTDHWILAWCVLLTVLVLVVSVVQVVVVYRLKNHIRRYRVVMLALINAAANGLTDVMGKGAKGKIFMAFADWMVHLAASVEGNRKGYLTKDLWEEVRDCFEFKCVVKSVPEGDD